MDSTSKRLLVLAIICALAVGLGVYRFLAKIDKMSTIEYTEEVVVATKDIPARTVLTSDMLKLERVPTGTRHPRAALQAAQLVGQITSQPIIAGEQVLTNRIFAAAQQSGLSFQLPTGYRAVSIGINQKISVANQIRPGDYVDVVASYEQVSQLREPQSTIVLQNLLVLAVGSEIRAGAAPPASAETITLAVKPEQAERLVWAEDYGKIRLILRPVLDSTIVNTPGVTARTVAGDR